MSGNHVTAQQAERINWLRNKANEMRATAAGRTTTLSHRETLLSLAKNYDTLADVAENEIFFAERPGRGSAGG
jgi:hypothetical protein